MKGNDKDEFFDFVNTVFGEEYSSFDYENNFPRPSCSIDEFISYQYALREDGQLRAVAGVIPYKFHAGDYILNMTIVANVATDKNHRKRNFMQSILTKAVQNMHSNKTDFSILIGFRERYRFFGYEMAGIIPNYNFTNANLRNMKRFVKLENYHFKLIESSDTETILKCLELYNQQLTRCERSVQNFLLTLYALDKNAYAIYNDAGEFSGYLSASRSFDSIPELCLTKPESFQDVIGSLIETFKIDSTNITIPSTEFQMTETALKICESCSFTPMSRMLIFQLDRVLTALLNMKQNCMPMIHGELVLESKLGKYLIKNDGSFSVECTQRKPDVTIPDGYIYQLLLGPVNYFFPYINCGEKSNLLHNWFPVPLYISTCDRY